MSSISSGLFGTMNPMAGSGLSPTNYSPLSGGSSLPSSISGAMSNPTAGNSVNGSIPSYAGTQLSSPPLPNFTGSGSSVDDLTNYQNQANSANASRFNQGMSVLAGGYNQGLSSIQDAMGSSQQYANANLGQVANQAGALGNQMNQQLATSGLGDSIQTMAALPQRVQATADQNINELANSRQAGLLQNAGSLTAQGGQGIANYAGSANVQAPSMSLYAPLMQQAAQQQQLQAQRQAGSQASLQNSLTQADNFLNNQGTGLPGQSNKQPAPQYADPGGYSYNTNAGTYVSPNGTQYASQQGYQDAVNGTNQGSTPQADSSSQSPYMDMSLEQLMNVPVNQPNTPPSQLQAPNAQSPAPPPAVSQMYQGADGSVYDQWGNAIS